MQLMSSATCYKSAAIRYVYEAASVNIRYMSDIIRYMYDIALLAYCISSLDIVIARDNYLVVT